MLETELVIDARVEITAIMVLPLVGLLVRLAVKLLALLLPVLLVVACTRDAAWMAARVCVPTFFDERFIDPVRPRLEPSTLLEIVSRPVSMVVVQS